MSLETFEIQETGVENVFKEPIQKKIDRSFLIESFLDTTEKIENFKKKFSFKFKIIPDESFLDLSESNLNILLQFTYNDRKLPSLPNLKIEIYSFEDFYSNESVEPEMNFFINEKVKKISLTSKNYVISIFVETRINEEVSYELIHQQDLLFKDGLNYINYKIKEGSFLDPLFKDTFMKENNLTLVDSFLDLFRKNYIRIAYNEEVLTEENIRQYDIIYSDSSKASESIPVRYLSFLDLSGKAIYDFYCLRRGTFYYKNEFKDDFVLAEPIFERFIKYLLNEILHLISINIKKDIYRFFIINPFDKLNTVIIDIE